MREVNVQGVDAGGEDGDIGAYFLAERGHVLADVLVSGVNHTPEGQANPKDGDDDHDGVSVHEAHHIT